MKISKFLITIGLLLCLYNCQPTMFLNEESESHQEEMVHYLRQGLRYNDSYPQK